MLTSLKEFADLHLSIILLSFLTCSLFNTDCFLTHWLNGTNFGFALILGLVSFADPLLPPLALLFTELRSETFDFIVFELALRVGLFKAVLVFGFV
jgi:hypothetical protein